MDVIITELAQSINPLTGCANPDLDTKLLHLSSLEYLTYAFQTPNLLVVTNAVKAPADNSDYARSHSARNKLQCFLVYCKLEHVDRSCYRANVGCVHHV